ERAALEYYKEWNPNFWESSDVRVREITRALEERMKGSLGADFAKAELESGRSNKTREEIVQRAQSVVKDVSLEHISQGIEILKKKVLADRQRAYHIVIDDLDKNWIDGELLHDLISTLLEA